MNKKHKFLLKLNLQHFASEEVGSEDVSSESTFVAPTSQSELDSIINKAVNTALENHKKKSEATVQSRIEEEIKKREDYAKLTEDQKRDKDFEDKQTKFNEEVAEFNHRKLVMEVKEDLVNKKLPVEFAETFALHGDAEKALEAVTAFEKAFNEAVSNKVKETARQSTPTVGGIGANKPLNMGERLAKGVSNKKPF